MVSFSDSIDVAFHCQKEIRVIQHLLLYSCFIQDELSLLWSFPSSLLLSFNAFHEVSSSPLKIVFQAQLIEQCGDSLLLYGCISDSCGFAILDCKLQRIHLQILQFWKRFWTQTQHGVGILGVYLFHVHLIHNHLGTTLGTRKSSILFFFSLPCISSSSSSCWCGDCTQHIQKSGTQDKQLHPSGFNSKMNQNLLSSCS